MAKRFTLATTLAAGALLLAACGGGSSSSSSSPSAAASGNAGADVKVGLAYDIGGRGDQSFNDAAARGLDKAKEAFGIQVKELEAGASETDAQKEERLRLLAQGGYNPVLAVGFAYANAVGKVAKEFPKTNFAIVDDASDASTGPNIANLIFSEEQGAYLVGVIAAEASKSGSIGFVGGVNIPLIKKFEAGYAAGAKSVKPDIKVQAKYISEPPDFSGFGDPAKGKVAAEGMYQSGTDVVFAAAGASGGGVFQAAKAAGEGNWAIGVDSDQYLTESTDLRDVILTSMVKKVDTSVYDMIKSVVDGKPLTGKQEFTLASDGVGYATSNPAIEPFKAKADEAAKQVESGAVKVPTS